LITVVNTADEHLCVREAKCAGGELRGRCVAQRCQNHSDMREGLRSC